MMSAEREGCAVVKRMAKFYCVDRHDNGKGGPDNDRDCYADVDAGDADDDQHADPG